jgi:hypothetical protein
MRIHSKRITHEFIGQPVHEHRSIHWIIIFEDGDLDAKQMERFGRTEVHQHIGQHGVNHYFHGRRTIQFRPEHTTDKVKLKIIQMITKFLLENEEPLVIPFQTPKIRIQ